MFDIAHHPPLTRERIGLAYATAVATDALQLLLGPVGWAFADELLGPYATLMKESIGAVEGGLSLLVQLRLDGVEVRGAAATHSGARDAAFAS